MTILRFPTRTSHRTGLALAIACALSAAPAAAQGHHARLSADLADHLSAQSPVIDVIVHGTEAEIATLTAKYNLVVQKPMKSGAVLRVNAGQLAALEADEAIDHLSGDVIIRSKADVTAETIGADQVWAGEGDLKPLSGAGVGVAVIDTGIDLRHAALRRRVVFTKDFTGGDGGDRFGHGTHVAGIIAGGGGVTDDTRDYRGIAFGANLINLRALGDDGSGTVSTVIEAIDWAVDHRHEFNIRVINLSLGTPVLQPYRDDPLCEAVARAVDAGVVVVAAAGNQGRNGAGQTVLGSITSPGNSPFAITVGALDAHDTPQRSDDTVAAYSSRGPTRYDLIIKPDVSAPGSHVVSTEAAGSYLSQTYPERHVAGSGANSYMQLSGTSMSAAVVSGAVALLLDQRRSLRPQSVKELLEVTASRIEGAGLVDAGVGSLNILSAAEFQPADFNQIPVTYISGEAVQPSGMFVLIVAPQNERVNTNIILSSTAIHQSSIVWGASILWSAADSEVLWAQPESIVWGANLHHSLSTESIVWGAAESIVWGAVADSIVWGASAKSIVWGAAAGSIVWGASGQSIVWGAAAESIVWGASAQSIVWGAAADSIVWGANAQSIVWGAAADSIVWGANAQSIVWGAAADSIVWGAAADSIVWGATESVPDGPMIP